MEPCFNFFFTNQLFLVRSSSESSENNDVSQSMDGFSGGFYGYTINYQVLLQHVVAEVRVTRCIASYKLCIFCDCQCISINNNVARRLKRRPSTTEPTFLKPIFRARSFYTLSDEHGSVIKFH